MTAMNNAATHSRTVREKGMSSNTIKNKARLECLGKIPLNKPMTTKQIKAAVGEPMGIVLDLVSKNPRVTGVYRDVVEGVVTYTVRARMSEMEMDDWADRNKAKCEWIPGGTNRKYKKRTQGTKYPEQKLKPEVASPVVERAIEALTDLIAENTELRSRLKRVEDALCATK